MTGDLAKFEISALIKIDMNCKTKVWRKKLMCSKFGVEKSEELEEKCKAAVSMKIKFISAQRYNRSLEIVFIKRVTKQ